MKTNAWSCASVGALLGLAPGCEEVPGETGEGGAGAATTGTGLGGGALDGTPLGVPVGEERVFVDLDGPGIVSADDAWELAFEGVDVFTNGGASGEGEGAAFGPLDDTTYLADTVPSNLPFLIEDEPGGAFLDWYAYDGSTHAIYSRYHVIGVRSGGAVYKVQILGYYGEVDGAPVTAIFRMRSARVEDGGAGPTHTWEAIDGTAGGLSPGDDDPSGCVRLETQEVVLLTPAEAVTSTEWDLCFRRDAIAVNGGSAGPGGVAAANLSADTLAGESLDEIKARTAESERAAFEAVDATALEVPTYRADGIVSAFTGAWLAPGDGTLAPARATWVVAGADGESPFFVLFEGLEGATATTVGTVNLRVKAIGGSLP